MVAMISWPKLNIKPHIYTKTHERHDISAHAERKKKNKLHVLLIAQIKSSSLFIGNFVLSINGS